jgi:hypothetical protein
MLQHSVVRISVLCALLGALAWALPQVKHNFS